MYHNFRIVKKGINFKLSCNKTWDFQPILEVNWEVFQIIRLPAHSLMHRPFTIKVHAKLMHVSLNLCTHLREHMIYYCEGSGHHID